MYAVPGLVRSPVSASPYWPASLLDLRAEAFRGQNSRDMVSHAQQMRLAKQRKKAFIAAQQILPLDSTGSYVIPVQSLTGETPASVLPVFSAS